MKHTLLKAVKAAVVSVLALSLGVTLQAQDLKPVSQEDIAKLKSVIPEKLPATAKSRRILVFWRCEGFVHGSAIEYGLESFRQLAAKHPAYKMDFSKEYSDLTAANLKKYDGVVLMNTTRLNTKDQANKNLEYDLINFVKSGKGLTVIHAGADNFYEAEAAAEMVGGRFWGHPWGGSGTWAFKLDDPDNAINKGFSSKTFKWGDEIYQQQSPFYNRAKLHVLVSLDMSDEATSKAGGQQREDKDNPVSWIRPYGKGRVFYTSFAHDQRAFLDKAVSTHIIAGLQYTLGDLKADDTPAGLTAKNIEFVKAADETGLHKAFALLQDALRNTNNEKVQKKNLSMILPVLSDSSATPQARQAVLRALIGSGIQPDADAVVPALKQKESRNWAVTLLTGIDTSAAKKALTSELFSSRGSDQVNLINAMVIRKESAPIIPLMASSDSAVAVAAISGVGRIADSSCLKALLTLKTEKLKDTRSTALGACIGTMAANGDVKSAAKAAHFLIGQQGSPNPLKAACAKALLINDPAYFSTGMKLDSAMARETVIRHADQVDSKMMVASMASASTEDKAAIITKLADKNATESAPAIAKMLDSDKPEVVAAALKALCKLGTAKDVPAMFAKLSAEDNTVKQAAQYALEDMFCADTSAALIKVAGSDVENQKRVINLLGERMKAADLPAFNVFIKSADLSVRKEAWKALGSICDEKSYTKLLGLLPQVQESDASRAASAINAAIGNLDPEERVQAITAAWSCETPAAKLALIDVMLRYSDDRYVPMISKAMNSTNKTVAESAIRTLGTWPTIKPYNDLVSSLKTQSDAGLKKAAYRGALKLAMSKGGKNANEMCTDLFTSAPTDKDRETLATVYYKDRSIDLFPMLKGCFNDPKCGNAAKLLYVKFYNEQIKPNGNIGSGQELDPKKWKVNASHGGNEAKNAIDRNDGSRWTSGGSQVGMWFTVDLGEKSFISEILLDTTGSARDTPNGCEVYVSDDGKNWGSPVAKADGKSEKTTTIKMSASGRYIKIVTTGKRNGLHWSIHELYIKAGLDKKVIEEIKNTVEQQLK